MAPEFTMLSRIVLGYGDRKFSVFTDGLIPFLTNCEKNHLQNVNEIADNLDDIKDLLLTSSCSDVDELKRHLVLLNDLIAMLKAVVFEEPK